MNNLKPIIAANLTTLRKRRGLTQAELAEQFHYSDKAVSRWERGDTLPEIDVLWELCRFYGITLDDLVQEGSDLSEKMPEKPQPDRTRPAKIAMSALAVSVVWLIATCLFVFSVTIRRSSFWQVFVYAVPTSSLALAALLRRWGDRRTYLTFNSVTIWSLLASLYIAFLKYNIWLIFIIGIPLQMIAILWYKIRRYKND